MRMSSVFGTKPRAWKEGSYVFTSVRNGDYNDFIFGVITGVDGDRIGLNGLRINPVGLKNKVTQNKAGPRSAEILIHPTAENCIHALIYRIEQDDFTGVVDANAQKVEPLSAKAHAILDGWIREEIPELVGGVLSLPPGAERDAAKATLRQKMGTLVDKDLRRNLYSVCRSLRILSGQE